MSAASQALAASVFLAVLGFSFALATGQPQQPDAASAAGARSLRGGRSVGGALRFTNAFVLAGTDPAFPLGGATGEPQGFDLGDVSGNLPVTRYVNATGGFLPYTFQPRPNFDFLLFGTSTLPSVDKNSNGKLTDQFATLKPGLSGVSARFDVVVTDFIATQRTGTFKFNLVQVPPAMRFAMDRLPTAQLGGTYFTSLDVLVPDPKMLPAKYVLAGGVTAGGKTFTRLEDVGLSLTSDGIIHGRPCVARASGSTAAQTIAFTVQAVDASGAIIAMSRDGTQMNQAFTITAENATQAGSEVTATNCEIQAYTNGITHGKDSLTYTGIFDPKNETNFSLAGTPFTLRIGNNIFNGNFDAKGKVSGTLADKKGSVSVSASTSTGLLSIKIKDANLATGIGLASDTTGVEHSVVFGFEFKHYRTSEVLVFSRKARGLKSDLQYRLGVGIKGAKGAKTATYAKGRTLGGAFQVLNVIGTDGKLSGDAGDAWYVKFIGVPRFGIDSGALTAIPLRDPSAKTQSGSVSATFRIGEDFSQTITATIASNRLRFKGKGTDAGIYGAALDGQHFVHSVTTNVIVGGDTGLPQAIKSRAPTIFKFGFDVPNFSGDTGRVIAPNGSLWIAR